MNFNDFEWTLENALRKLRLSSESIRAQAFDILNDGYRSMESDETKAKELNFILTNNRSQRVLIGSYCLDDIIKLLIFAEKIEPEQEYWKLLEEEEPEVPEEKWGVHETHCCSKHGCKYGDSKCPVVTGKIKQKYPCEWCEEDEFDELCRNANK